MAKLDAKRLMAAIGSRGVGSAVGGAAYALGEKYVPINNNSVRLGLLAVAGALVPELNPKMKTLDYAGSGFVGAVASDATRLLMNSNKVQGIGAQEREYVIDEDSDVNGLSDEAESGLSGADDDEDINGNSDEDNHLV